MGRRTAVFLLATAFLAPLLLWKASAPAFEEPANVVAKPADAVDYETHIKPLFQRYCYDCHIGKKAASGFRVETGALAVRGGDRGASVVAGKSDESILWQALVGKGDVARMPQDSDPLSDKDIDLVKRWIDAGARVPANETADDPP